LQLLSVAEALHKRGLRCEFEFIGYANQEDDYAAEFLERIKPLEAIGCARFVGQMQGEGLMRRFDEAAGIVHFPSEEAFGLVVVESLARGLKFFGANLGGIADIASNVGGAELFEKEDWEGLTEAIARWVQQGHPRLENAEQLMRTCYHPQVIARHHTEIYDEVLKTRV